MDEIACGVRLSPWRRGEDEGEGFAVGFEQFCKNYPSAEPVPLPSLVPQSRVTRAQVESHCSCSRGPVGRRLLRWTECRSAHRTDSSCGEPVAPTRLVILPTFVLPCRAKSAQYDSASGSFGVLLGVPPDPFPMGSIATQGSGRKTGV
jgi:hypothetical protein